MRLYSKLKNHIVDFTNISENGVYKLYHVVKPDFTYIGSTYRNDSKKCKRGMYECFSVNPLNYYYYYKPII